jgi:hypothetical protein
VVDEKHQQQDVPSEEALVARLRAADPASGVEPDLVALRAAVDARRAATPSDQLAARRPRWTSWPARAAAVAAAALVVGGGGGYAIGAAGAGDSGGGFTAEAPITLQAPETAADAGAGAPEIAAAPGGRTMAGLHAMWGGWYGRTVFHGSGLSTDSGSARGWALDASGVSAQAAAAAASALGVTGEPRLEWGSWVVGSNDGTGPSLTLSADGQGALSYADPRNDVWYCDPSVREEATSSDGAVEGGATEGAGAAPSVVEPCGERDLGPAPSEDEAARQLRDLMSRLGVDPAGYEVVVEDYGDPYVFATAYHVVDGQRTGLTWSASFSGAGVTWLSGFTASLVDLGEYDVVSPAEAVERMNDPRFGAGWSGPIALARDASAAAAETGVVDEPDGTPPAPAAPGSAFAWPVTDVTIVEARLGVAVTSTRDGAAVLAPTYELTADDGSVWSVIAVAERHLDFAR